MEKEAKFQMVYQSLVDGNKEYVDFISKVNGVLVIATGWFVANNDPFPQLINKTLVSVVLVGIFLGTMTICWISIFHYLRSQERLSLLKEINYMDESLFKHYVITLSMIVPAMLIHSGLFTSLWCLIYFKYSVV